MSERVRQLILLSAGGTSIDVLGLIEDINERLGCYEVIGFLDDAKSKHGHSVQDLPVLGPLSDVSKYRDVFFVNCLGAPGNYWRRATIVERLGLAADRFETLIHPMAAVSRHSTLEPGAIVYPHAFIGSGVKIGRQVLVMSHASINHDVTIGDYAIVATGAIVLGKVSLGSSCYVGAGASIRQDLSVGRRSLVGMGSVVVKSIGDNCLVMGVPARFTKPAIPLDGE